MEEIKPSNTSNISVDNYRKLVQTYIDLHIYSTALFWADKVVAITGNPKDVYWLAQCMYLLKQYHRAAYLLKSKNLDRTNLQCAYLTARCLFEANELGEALKIINNIDSMNFVPPFNTSTSFLLINTPKNQAYSSFLLLKGKILEGMDNRGLAADCYKQALHFDVHCFEAFDSLIKYQMLTSSEEEDLLKSLPISDQCSIEEAEILQTLYESKLKKYHTHTLPKPNESKIMFGSTPGSTDRSLNIMHLTPNPTFIHSGFSLSTPTLVSTPNVVRNNDKNLKKTERDILKNDDSQMQVESQENACLIKLKNSLDLQVAEAERLCHLPLLYIGLECGLTNNVRLADKFFQQAQSIAPDDPFIMHEKGVIAFQNLDYKTAETQFRKALERVKRIKKGIVPQRWSPLLNNLGHASRKLKKYEEALNFHNQVAANDS
ncbi:unnamed protein product [Psylliodes chrysocephalus]|uniref:Uncharacterized protein n=1 Tax=Psylliodes chrysocephalus TaxID=3402493 RepID=A0A9P0CML4_9CUCU|nr:unnamed protein product [Psylliodes chrysocephala]